MEGVGYSQYTGQYDNTAGLNNGATDAFGNPVNAGQYGQYGGLQDTPLNDPNIPNSGDTAAEDKPEHSLISTFDNSDSLFDQKINNSNKGTIILVVFGGVVGAYLIISAIIYIASYFIKSKNDDLAEEFYKEVTKETKEGNQFFMDPAIHKNAPKTPVLTEKEKYRNMDIDEYDDIWESFIVTGKKEEIEINVDKVDDYPVTTPVSPAPSPLHQTFVNDTYTAPSKDYGVPSSNVSPVKTHAHRESNSTSSSTASVTNLIPKHQQKTNELYNLDEIHPRSSSEARQHSPRQPPPHYQFPNGRTTTPQVKFSMDQAHSPREHISPKLSSPIPYQRPPNPRSPTFNVERTGSQNSNFGRSPNPRSPTINVERTGSQGGYGRSPNPRSPNFNVERTGSQNSNFGRSPNPRSPNFNVERTGSQNSNFGRSPNPRSPNLERTGSQGGYGRPPNPRSPNFNVERTGSQNSNFSRSPNPRSPNLERTGSHSDRSRPANPSQFNPGTSNGGGY